MSDVQGIIRDLTAAEYHSDPCPHPSLSSSIARILCESSPAHARAAHPKLNPQVIDDEAEHFDIGTAAHSILLEGVNAVEIIQADNYRTNVAKAARDAARANGKTPLLAKVWADVQAMVAATRAQLDAHVDGRAMFKDGSPEQTLIWNEDGVWCRARLDWLRAGAIDDYKTTSTTANPEAVSRTLFSNGWDIQCAFYLRGLKAITREASVLSATHGGEDAIFRFAVQETYAPYALSVVALGPDAMVLAEKKVLYAIELWRECLKSNKWPAYPNRTAYASLPTWVESAWLAREGEL